MLVRVLVVVNNVVMTQVNISVPQGTLVAVGNVHRRLISVAMVILSAMARRIVVMVTVIAAHVVKMYKVVIIVKNAVELHSWQKMEEPAVIQVQV